MLFKSIAQLACLVLATAEVQPKANDSPPHVLYMAQFKWSAGGEVNFTCMTNESVLVNVDVSLPSTGAPFQYHIHEKPASWNEIDCMVTGGHLNPYNGNPKANSTDELEVGDLSGRHGLITQDQIKPGIVAPNTYKAEYADQYISLNPDSPAFIGEGRSVTFHYSNGTRFACANITKVESKEPASINSSNSSGDEPENLAGTTYPKMFTVVGAIAGLSLLI